MLCTSEKRSILTLFTNHESDSSVRFLNKFEETLRQWRTWDNVTVMQNYQLIRDHLYDLFHRGLKVRVCFVWLIRAL